MFVLTGMQETYGKLTPIKLDNKTTNRIEQRKIYSLGRTEIVAQNS